MRWSVVVTVVLVAACGAGAGDGAHDTEGPAALETDSDAFVDERPPCEHFCVAITHACPDDDTCRTSCEGSTTPPSDADITCAQEATSCESTFSCWDFLSLGEVPERSE